MDVDEAPQYRQIVDRLRADIAAGRLKPGEQLPTIPALCERFGVSATTVRRALSELRAAGLVVIRQGLGSFVRDGAAAEPDRLAALEARVAALEERVGLH